MSAFGNFLNIVFPEIAQRRHQQALRQLQTNIESSLSPFGPQTQEIPFQAETFGTEDPLQQLQTAGQSGLRSIREQPGLFTQPQIKGLAGLMASPETRQFGQQLLEQALSPVGGPFEGTSFTAQGGNVLINAANKLRNNEPLNSTLKDQVNFVASNLSKPRTITDAAGNVQTIPGQDLSNFSDLLAMTGYERDKGQQTIKPKTGPQAAAIANAQSALDDLHLAKQSFFNGKGELNRGTAFASNVPFIGGIPGTTGRDARQQVRRAIETILRARSGAAVPPDEVDNYMDLYAPSINDTDQGAALKIQRLEEFFSTSLQLMQAPGWKPESIKNIRSTRPSGIKIIKREKL